MTATQSATGYGGDLTKPGVFQRIVDELRTEAGLGLKELAALTHVQPRQVRNWETGYSRPSAESRDRLLDVAYLMSHLADVYTPEGVEVWLHGRNRHLGGQRPIDLLEAGDFDVVRREVERLNHGVAT